MGAFSLFTYERQFQTLREQLSLYGLNPSEWNIFSRHGLENVYQLEHRGDPDFKINVQVRSLRTGFIRVERLSVVSL